MKLLLFVIIIFTDSSDCLNILQPPSVFSREGEKAVTLKCEQDDQLNYYIFWYRQNRNAEMQLVAYSINKDIVAIEAPFSESKYTMSRPAVLHSSLQINSVDAADSAVYYCASRTGTDTQPAYFGQGTKLTVLEENHDITPPKVEVLEPSPSECSQDKKKTLVCVASEFYPDHVTVYWQVNGINVTKGVATDNNAKRVEKFYTITSRLMVDEKEWHTVDTEFKCIVNFFDGKNNIDYPASVSGKKDDAMTRERYLRITQGAKLSYGVFIVKSCLYGAFVAFLVWKLQKSSGKLKN